MAVSVRAMDSGWLNPARDYRPRREGFALSRLATTDAGSRLLVPRTDGSGAWLTTWKRFERVPHAWKMRGRFPLALPQQSAKRHGLKGWPRRAGYHGLSSCGCLTPRPSRRRPRNVNPIPERQFFCSGLPPRFWKSSDGISQRVVYPDRPEGALVIKLETGMKGPDEPRGGRAFGIAPSALTSRATRPRRCQLEYVAVLGVIRTKD